MTTIHDVPEETLMIIFENLEACQIKYCQEACRAWYFPAHIRLLKHIDLDTLSSIQRFIASINCNANRSYLNAVQHIRIDTKDCFSLEKPTIELLFTRFPNLSSIQIKGEGTLFDHFNDQVCEAILDRCPKLNSVYVRVGATNKDAAVQDVLFHVRLLLTVMDGEDAFGVAYNDDGGEESHLAFLSKFPRLKVINGPCGHVQNFEAWLDMVQVLPHLSSMYLSDMDDDQESLEYYLASITADEKRTITKRLSGIKQLDILREFLFCPTSMVYAARYLTGLEKFDLNIESNRHWTNNHTEIFRHCILDLACSAKTSCSIYLNALNFCDLANCLPDIVKKVIRQAPTNAKKSLEVTLRHSDVAYKEITVLGVYINKQQQSPEYKISVELSADPSMHDVTSRLLRTPLSMSGVDSLTLEFYDVCFNPYANVNSRYPQNFLSLKDAALDPKDKATTGISFDKVKTLKLRAGQYVEFHPLLCNRYPFLFPHLDTLILDYYCNCVWIKDTNVSFVSFPTYSLTTLMMDMTPALKKLKHHIDSGAPMETLCYRVNVTMVGDSNQQQQQNSFCVSPQMTRVENTTTACAHGKMSLVLNITIHSLRRLDLVLHEQLSANSPCNLFKSEIRKTLFDKDLQGRGTKT